MLDHVLETGAAGPPRRQKQTFAALPGELVIGLKAGKPRRAAARASHHAAGGI
jgi:hypothetical protein